MRFRPVAQPGVLEADELGEVVAPPLERRATSPQARELRPGAAWRWRCRKGCNGAPDKGVGRAIAT